MTDLELNYFQNYIAQIFIAFSILGILAVICMFVLIKKINDNSKLDKFRSKEDGFADLLNYASVVDDGVIVCKNGCLIAGFLYEGKDLENISTIERDDISNKLNQLFANIDSGWMIHTDAVRIPVPQYIEAWKNNFPDKISQAIDNERRAFFENRSNSYSSFFVITFTWYPPKLSQRRLADAMFTKDKVRKNDEQKTRQIIDEFNNSIKGIEASLEVIFPKIERLKSYTQYNEDGSSVVKDQLLSWIWCCIYGNWQQINLPKNPIFIDSILGGEDFWSGIVPKLGNKFIRTLSIEGIAGETCSSMLTILSEMGCEYRWNTRFIFLDKNEATHEFKKLRGKWKMKERGLLSLIFKTNSNSVNLDATAKVAEADEALADISAGFISFGYITNTIVLLDESQEKLNEKVILIKKNIESLGLRCRSETINNMDAYFGTLPGHAHENLRRPIVSTFNLADVLPTTAPWLGKDYCPNPQYPLNSPCLMKCVTGASLNTTFNLNLFGIQNKDLGHALIFGPSGAGKSTLLATLAAQALRYKNMRIFSFDKGLSMYALCKAVSGIHFNPAGDGDSLAFCPLEFIAKAPKEKRNSLKMWFSEWIQHIVELNGISVTAEITNEINKTIDSTLAAYDINNKFVLNLGLFIAQIQNNEVREAFAAYVNDGVMASLLDAKEDGINFSNFTVFEIETLMELGDKYSLPVLEYIFKRIETSLDGSPAMVFLDEAWLMLAHPIFKEKIREWLKVFRKQNCSVIMATQSISDAQNSGILDALVENTSTKIFLPNAAAITAENQVLYSKFGLNDTQIQVIAASTPKRDYFIKTEMNGRRVQLALGPLTLAFTGVSGINGANEINSFIEKYGENWTTEYLKKKGIDLNDYLQE